MRGMRREKAFVIDWDVVSRIGPTSSRPAVIRTRRKEEEAEEEEAIFSPTLSAHINTLLFLSTLVLGFPF